MLRKYKNHLRHQPVTPLPGVHIGVQGGEVEGEEGGEEGGG